MRFKSSLFWKVAAIFSVLIFSDLKAHAQDRSDQNEEFYQKLTRVVNGQKMITASIFYGFLEMIVDENTSKLRRQRLDGIYDWGPDEKEKLRKFLIEPCSRPNYGRCGFKVSIQDDDQFEKDIFVLGEKIKFRIRLRSVTKSPNRNSYKSDPVLRRLGDSWYAELEEALKKDSIIMILSHSRHGGGPDPYYTEISPQGRIRYKTWYAEQNIGLSHMTKTYAPVGQNQIFVIGACLSDKYFRDALMENVSRQGKEEDEFLFLGTKRNLKLVDFDVATKEIIGGITFAEGPKELSANWKNPRESGPDTCFKFSDSWRGNQ